MVIGDLGDYPAWLSTLARWPFDQCGAPQVEVM